MFLLLAAFATGLAGPAPEVRPPSAPERQLSLAEALPLARERNPALRVSRLGRVRARAAEDRAWAGRHPALGLGLTYGSTPALAPPAGTGFVTLSYNLDTTGETALRLRLAADQVRVAAAEVAQAEQKADLDVTLAYLDLQEAQARVRIAAAAVANANVSVADAENLGRAGEATVFDVQRAKVFLARSNQALAAAERDRTMASAALGRLLGLGPDARLEASDPVALAGTWDVPPDETLGRALAARPEIRRAGFQVDLARSSRDLALAGLGVRSRLFASRDGSLGHPLNQNVTLGAAVEWNPFDGGAAWAGAREAEADEAAARERLADAQNEVAVEIARAFAQLETGRKTMDLAAEAVAIAQNNLTSARKRFKAGIGTQGDVIDAENDLIQAEGDKVRSILDYNRALATLRRAGLQPPSGD